jgi:hypothetical protein
LGYQQERELAAAGVCGKDVGVTKSRPLAMGAKFRRILARLQKVRGMDEHERILFARSMAATPTQRWQIHNNTLRSLGLSKLSARKKSAS